MTLCAVVWADSFGSQTLTAYSFPGGGVFTINATGGRGGRASLGYPAGGVWAITPPLGASCTRWIFDVAVKPSGTTGAPNFYFKSADNSTHAALSQAGGGGYNILQGSSTIIGTTSPIPSGVWTHVMFAAYFHASAGTLDVWLNESHVFTASGLALPGGTGGVVTAYSDCTLTAGPSICDLVVQASTGSTDTQVGDRAVMWLPPNGAGANSAWSVTGAASDWQATDESPPDGDTSYISTSSIGDKDTMAMTDLPAGVLSVQGVVAKWVVRKTDAGSRQVAPMWHIGGTDYVGTGQVMGTNYAQSFQAYPQNPATATDWTVSDVNGAELGVELSA